MSEGKYVPYTEDDWKRWYPGQLSDERRKQLEEMRYSALELTPDDMIFWLSRFIPNLYQNLLRSMISVVGPEQTKAVLAEYGRSRGKYMLGRAMAALGTDDPTPAQWSWYQDCAHASGGLEYSQSYSEYDDEKCVIKRAHCNWFCTDPELKGYCKHMDLGMLQSYMEQQPTIEAIMVKSMPDGDEYCEHWFRRKK